MQSNETIGRDDAQTIEQLEIDLTRVGALITQKLEIEAPGWFNVGVTLKRRRNGEPMLFNRAVVNVILLEGSQPPTTGMYYWIGDIEQGRLELITGNPLGYPAMGDNTYIDYVIDQLDRVKLLNLTWDWAWGEVFKDRQPSEPEPSFEFDPDCSKCLRGRTHTLHQHEAAIRRALDGSRL